MSVTEDSGMERGGAADGLAWDEERYASLVANVPGAVYRCAMTSEWDMQFMSPEIENISGYAAHEFTGPKPSRAPGV